MGENCAKQFVFGMAADRLGEETMLHCQVLWSREQCSNVVPEAGKTCKELRFLEKIFVVKLVLWNKQKYLHW